MPGTRLKVHAWAGSAVFAAALPALRRDLLVIAVRTPPGGLRETARVEVRSAATLALAAWSGCAVDQVILHSAPGHPVTASVAGQEIGISLAHEPGVNAGSPGLSLVALNRNGKIGVDVLRGDGQFDSEAVADLYLSPAARLRMTAGALADRHATFAREWASVEAGYKCLGQALSEWTPEVETALRSCDYRQLHGLPLPFVGAVALPRN